MKSVVVAPRRRIRLTDPEGTFSRKAVSWGIGIAIVSFAITLVLAAFGEEMTWPVTAAPSAYSYSAIGHHALVELLAASGVRAMLRRDPKRLGGGPGAAVLLDEPDLDAMRTQRTTLGELFRAAAARNAPVVLVLPKWIGQPDEHDPPWVASVTSLSSGAVASVLQASDDPRLTGVGVSQTDAPFHGRATGTLGRFEVELDRAQLLAPGSLGSLQPLLGVPGGTLIAASPGRTLIVVSDPDLLDDHGIGRADHAAILRALIAESRVDTVIVDEAIHGFRIRENLLAEMMRFPLAVATLHGTLLLGLVLWAGMGRFGKPHPMPPALKPGKQALIDNTASLLIAGGHTADSVSRYYRETIRSVAAHHQIPGELPESEIAVRLQKITEGKRLDFPMGRAWIQIRGLSSGPRVEERAVRVAWAIHRWRMEMMDAG